jgi:exosome complex component RRP4
MARDHRPGHRRRGHEDPSSYPSGDRVLVLPGEEIAGSGLKPGPGTYRVGGKVYASVLGLLSARPPLVRVVPLSGRYLPKAGDVVVGTVADVQGTFWLLDIGAPRWAPLHMTGTPWDVQVGETEKFLRVGDAVVVQVESLDATGRIGVTMQGERLGKLEGGTIVRIAAARVGRVVGRNGSMIEMITRRTGAQISVGQNGRIWVDGAPPAMQRVVHVLQMIDQEGMRPGLTERVESYLSASGPSDDRGPAEAPRESAGRDAPAPPWAADDANGPDLEPN